MIIHTWGKAGVKGPEMACGKVTSLCPNVSLQFCFSDYDITLGENLAILGFLVFTLYLRNGMHSGVHICTQD